MDMKQTCIVWGQQHINYFISNPHFTTKKNNKFIRILKKVQLYLMIKSEKYLNQPKDLSLSSQNKTQNQKQPIYLPINLYNNLVNLQLIIYNNKMKISEEKLNDFFNHYFHSYNKTQSSQTISDFDLFLKWGLDLKSYKNLTMNYIKPIKDFGFIKKYEIICSAMPYVTNIRPEQLQNDIITTMIKQTYDTYLQFCKQRLWKTKQYQNHLQEYILFYLHELYISDSRIKRKYFNFDKFLLNIFYTLNILKSCNKNVRNFANFLHPTYSWGQLFLYICLKNITVKANHQQVVKASTLRKVIKLFQSEDSQMSHSTNTSQYISRNSFDREQEKPVCVNSIFTQPIGGCLTLPKVKMFKIMKICKVIQPTTSEKQTLLWSQFIQKYYQMVQQRQQMCFDHIVSTAVAKCTYQLSQKLLPLQTCQRKQQFLQQTFSYVFQLLQLIFCENQAQIEDEKTFRNIQSLRKHYKYMKQLSQYNILIMNKFAKKILKNNFILQLYKKYQNVENN